MNPTVHMGVRDVARILGKSRSTVKRMALAGEIPATKLPGPVGAYVFDRAEIEAIAGASC